MKLCEKMVGGGGGEGDVGSPIPNCSYRTELYNAWKVSKYGDFSGIDFPIFWLSTDQKKLRIWTLFTQYWYFQFSFN